VKEAAELKLDVTKARRRLAVVPYMYRRIGQMYVIGDSSVPLAKGRTPFEACPLIHPAHLKSDLSFNRRYGNLNPQIDYAKTGMELLDSGAGFPLERTES